MRIYSFQKVAAKDHSTHLFRITDKLVDAPFWYVYRYLVLDFKILSFWIIGRLCIAIQNISVTRRLLNCIVDFIISLWAQLIRTKGGDGTFWRHAK